MAVAKKRQKLTGNQAAKRDQKKKRSAVSRERLVRKVKSTILQKPKTAPRNKTPSNEKKKVGKKYCVRKEGMMGQGIFFGLCGDRGRAGTQRGDKKVRNWDEPAKIFLTQGVNTGKYVIDRPGCNTKKLNHY